MATDPKQDPKQTATPEPTKPAPKGAPILGDNGEYKKSKYTTVKGNIREDR